MIYAGDHSPADLNAPTPDTIRGDGPANPAQTNHKKPLPTCIHSAKELEPERMMRFVIGPDDALYPDFAENLPGQVLWCSLYRETLLEALSQDSFTKAAGKPLTIPADMVERVEKGLRNQALSLLSITKKAGHLMTGAEKVEQTLRSGKAGIYLTASAKDADTREKLSYLAQEANVRVVDIFTSEELSKASGASKVFHAVMTRGGTTDRFFTHVKRMTLFRNQVNK